MARVGYYGKAKTMEREQVAGEMSQPRQDGRKEMKAGKRRGTHWRREARV